MGGENLVRRPKKRFVATTNSDHGLPVFPNLAAKMDVTAPDQLWVSDLIYIRLGHEFISCRGARCLFAPLFRLVAWPTPGSDAGNLGPEDDSHRAQASDAPSRSGRSVCF